MPTQGKGTTLGWVNHTPNTTLEMSLPTRDRLLREMALGKERRKPSNQHDPGTPKNGIRRTGPIDPTFIYQPLPSAVCFRP